VAEWSNVPDSKSGVPQGTVGSNPTLSANAKPQVIDLLGVFGFFVGFACPCYKLALQAPCLRTTMPRLAPYLQRRGYGLTFRIAVPPDLRPLVGIREITRALPTSDRQAATPTALQFASAAKQLFCDLRAVMADTESDNGERGPGLDLDKVKAALREARLRLMMSELKDDHLEAQAAWFSERRALLKAHGQELRLATLEAENGALKGFLARSDAQPMPPHATRSEASPQTLLEQPSPMIGEVVEAFLKQYERRGKPQMLKKHKPVLTMLLDVVGDKPVKALKQADINEFFEVLTALPPRWGDHCRRLGVSVRELAAMEHEQTIGPKTFEDTYIASIRPFLKAAKKDWGDQGFPLGLTTDGIEYLGDQEEDVNKQRAFKPEELKRLFGGAEMKAFANDPERADCYWLPTVGLFTGARVNELCQLNPQLDILQDIESGVWHFWVNAETEADKDVKKSVKTGDERKVPIHKKLIELGFLERVRYLKSIGVKRLFPSWQPVRGRASGEAEKWFRQFLRDTGLRDDTPKMKILGMHAFRHTLLTYGKAQKPVPLNLMAITGHAQVHEGFSAVAAGYLDRSILDTLPDSQGLLDQLSYAVDFHVPLRQR
jgi:integrase